VIRRILAAGSGLCIGTAAGFLLTDGDFVGLAIMTVITAAACGAAWVIVPRDARASVLPLVVFATLIRVALAVVLYDGLLAAGRGGFVTGDDAGYADLSSRLARILHGEAAPFDRATESYLLGTFVYLETAVFYFLGPKVLVIELLNAAMGGLLVAFVFDITRRLFVETRTGLISASLVAFFPSLILWSALNLKDSLTLLLIALVVWLVVQFYVHGAWWLVPASFAPLLPLETLRNYIFVGLALIIPASVILAPNGAGRRRVVTSALASGLSTVLLVYHFLFRQGIPSLSDLDATRFAMGFLSNTFFGDQPLIVRAAYVLFAPFPWAVRRGLDLLPLPEMLVWSVALAGAAFVIVRHQRSWRLLSPLILFIAWTFLVFLVAEGNVGTLFRHRAMVIPFVLILAAPAFGLALARTTRVASSPGQASNWPAHESTPGRSR
jgi:dolichyl-phosphate-mannose-protein mannosyltransferase